MPEMKTYRSLFRSVSGKVIGDRNADSIDKE